ncbi:MAG: preprotein translocase subunit YajC [Alphaproteobacteria bacterium]|nr:preprotein translocase subunit YajC [Alphaproteobacteria bacterium]
MLNISDLFIGTAWAQEATQQSTMAASGDALMKFMPLFLIFAVFYFLLIRPQQKKLDEQTAMLKALKKGDKVITAGGVIGTIHKVEGEEYLQVEVADGIRLKVVRSTVSGLVKSDAAPAKDGV